MRRIRELFVFEAPLATKYFRAFWLILVLIALMLGASATESTGGTGG